MVANLQEKHENIIIHQKYYLTIFTGATAAGKLLFFKMHYEVIGVNIIV